MGGCLEVQKPWEGHDAPVLPCLYAADHLEFFNNLLSAVQSPASFACALSLGRRMPSYKPQRMLEETLTVSPEAFHTLR